MADVELTIEYVNARKDNRPPSLKGSDGNYYTLSDAAYDAMLPWKGHTGMLTFTTNAKGFHNATHWNGMELPRSPAPAPQKPAPQIKPPPPQAPQAKANGHAPFGFVHIEGLGNVRTMPVLREQAILQWVGIGLRSGAVDFSTEGLLNAINIVKQAWARGVDNPPTKEVGTPFPDDDPPIPSPDDYGANEPF